MFELQQAVGMASKDERQHIGEKVTPTACDLCGSAEAASYLLDSHPDLVQTLFNVRCARSLSESFLLFSLLSFPFFKK